MRIWVKLELDSMNLDDLAVLQAIVQKQATANVTIYTSNDNAALARESCSTADNVESVNVELTPQEVREGGKKSDVKPEAKPRTRKKKEQPVEVLATTPSKPDIPAESDVDAMLDELDDPAPTINATSEQSDDVLSGIHLADLRKLMVEIVRKFGAEGTKKAVAAVKSVAGQTDLTRIKQGQFEDVRAALRAALSSEAVSSPPESTSKDLDY